MSRARLRHLTITVLVAFIAAVAAGPAGRANATDPVVAGPPSWAVPFGSPVNVSHANGQVDQFQLFTDGAFYPNIPAADLWYLPQGGTTWIEVGCGVPIDIAPTILAAEGADGGIEAFVEARGGYNTQLCHAHQVGPGGSWQSGWVGSIQKYGFNGGGTPQLVKTADGRLHLFLFDETWQIAYFGQTAPAGPWTAWQPLGAGPFGMPVTMISAKVAESTDGTLSLTSYMVGGPPTCTATTRLAPGQSTWSGWQVDPTAPAFCPLRPH